MKRAADLSFLAGGGEMGERTRAMDWSTTAVGSPKEWPQSFKTAVSICLKSKHPMVLWWGNPGFTQFYNDPYISFLGEGKHPIYLGRSGRDCWSEIWPTIGPMLESVYSSGEATWSEDLLLILQRKLPREEGYFTFSYSPIRDDIRPVGGRLYTGHDTTDKLIGERRFVRYAIWRRGWPSAKVTTATGEIAAGVLAETLTAFRVPRSIGSEGHGASCGFPLPQYPGASVLSSQVPLERYTYGGVAKQSGNCDGRPVELRRLGHGQFKLELPALPRGPWRSCPGS